MSCCQKIKSSGLMMFCLASMVTNLRCSSIDPRKLLIPKTSKAMLQKGLDLLTSWGKCKANIQIMKSLERVISSRDMVSTSPCGTRLMLSKPFGRRSSRLNLKLNLLPKRGIPVKKRVPKIGNKMIPKVVIRFHQM